MFGHDAGDQALVAVAQSLRAGLRDYDVCARLAGDEFVVVLADCNEEQAHCKRLALQRAVAGVVFRPAADRVAPLSISAGIATFPADGESPAALLAAADRRMYRDKSARAAGNHGTGNPLRS
jgi:diguanylate cyclase (GGDEF)-like protein